MSDAEEFATCRCKRDARFIAVAVVLHLRLLRDDAETVDLVSRDEMLPLFVVELARAENVSPVTRYSAPGIGYPVSRLFNTHEMMAAMRPAMHWTGSFAHEKPKMS